MVQFPALQILAELVQQHALPLLLSATSTHSLWQSLLALPTSFFKGQWAFHPQALCLEAALPNTDYPWFCRVTLKTTFLRWLLPSFLQSKSLTEKASCEVLSRSLLAGHSSLACQSQLRWSQPAANALFTSSLSPWNRNSCLERATCPLISRSVSSSTVEPSPPEQGSCLHTQELFIQNTVRATYREHWHLWKSNSLNNLSESTESKF